MECLADLGYKARIDIDSLGAKMYVIEGDWSDKRRSTTHRADARPASWNYLPV
ncbi:hypothetical protein NKG05_30530 [Oerskovia sp. M15]